MAGSDVSPLVTCEWLHGKINAGDLGNIVLLDVSWSSQKDCHEEFKKRHIPGARYLNIMVGPHTQLFPRNLPSPEVFQEAARAVGVNDDSRVVVYSDSDNNGFFLSGRAWWTFTVFGAKSVSILNGGLQRWMSLGYTVTSETTDVQTGNFTARYDERHRRTFEDMSKLVESGSCILDSRHPDKFNDGHVPGATNLPYTDLVDDVRKEMVSTDDVRKVLTKSGVDLTKPMISYCNSGMSSCTLAFAYMLCGGEDYAVYHGGFTEWKNRAKDKIEKS